MSEAFFLVRFSSSVRPVLILSGLQVFFLKSPCMCHLHCVTTLMVPALLHYRALRNLRTQIASKNSGSNQLSKSRFSKCLTAGFLRT